jgi:hypothetical protein
MCEKLIMREKLMLDLMDLKMGKVEKLAYYNPDICYRVQITHDGSKWIISVGGKGRVPMREIEAIVSSLMNDKLYYTDYDALKKEVNA